MSPTPTDIYRKVIDVSQHQGATDFGTMRNRGIDGLIIRTNHSLIVDARCRTYYRDALTAGFPVEQIGFYTFVNPKRASARDAAQAFVDTVEWIGAPEDSLLMLDIESYLDESPNIGTIWPASRYAPWLREHIATVVELAPDCRLIAYSNASFWNPWVGDQALADSLEWIVPRYPVYSAAGYASNPVPAVGGWAGWAWRAGPKGPIPPSGATWAGWQFSAGYNRQGPVYGCQSSDLDLNVVEASAWARWTNTTPAPIPEPGPVPPDEEDDVKALLYTVTDGASSSWFYVSPDRNVGQVRNGNEYQDWKAAGALERNAESAGHFREMLTTFQPVGKLGTQGQAVLGAEATADWNARATVTVTVPPITVPPITVKIPPLSMTAVIAPT